MNNDFEQSLKVNDEIKLAIEAVEEAYRKQGRKLHLRDKEKLKMYLNNLNKKYTLEEMDQIEKQEMGYNEEK